MKTYVAAMLLGSASCMTIEVDTSYVEQEMDMSNRWLQSEMASIPDEKLRQLELAASRAQARVAIESQNIVKPFV